MERRPDRRRRGPGRGIKEAVPHSRPFRMDFPLTAALIALLILCSAFFSLAEISMAAARRLRLRQMAEDGSRRAHRALQIQEKPGNYFTVVQIGQNMVAILGGIVGEGALTPYFVSALAYVASPQT